MSGHRRTSWRLVPYLAAVALEISAATSACASPADSTLERTWELYRSSLGASRVRAELGSGLVEARGVRLRGDQLILVGISRKRGGTRVAGDTASTLALPMDDVRRYDVLGSPSPRHTNPVPGALLAAAWGAGLLAGSIATSDDAVDFYQHFWTGVGGTFAVAAVASLAKNLLVRPHWRPVYRLPAREPARSP